MPRESDAAHRISIKTRAVSIPELLRLATRNSICLPSFQRDFVWNPNQMAALLESVVRHYPIGTIMLVGTSGNADLGWQPFIEPMVSGGPPRHYVIDGQQRVRSFLRLLSLNGGFRLRPPFEFKGQSYRFYLDTNFSIARIDSLRVGDDLFVFASPADEDEVDDFRWQGDERCIPTEFLLSETLSVRWAKKVLGRYGPVRRRAVLGRIRDIRRRITAYSCPLETIERKLKPANHADMFHLLNEAGTDLSAFDLTVAKLDAEGVNLRRLWKQSCRDLPSLDEFAVDPMYVLKVMALMRQADQPDPTCKLPKRRGLLKFYDVDGTLRREIELDWRAACRSIDAVISDLKHEFGVPGPKYLPYAPMIIPMAATDWYVRRHKGYNPRYRARMKVKLRHWYWGAVFDKAYEKATDTRAGQDFSDLKRWLPPGSRTHIPHRINFDLTRSEVDEVIERVGSAADAVYKAILCMPIAGDARDIYSNDFLGSDARLHDHHIFPKAFLEKQIASLAGTKREKHVRRLMNHPLNRMLITDATNENIKAKPPHKYAKGLGTGVLRRHFLSRTHLINDEDFVGFCGDRKQRIIKHVMGELLA
jgi:hypothetical protein